MQEKLREEQHGRAGKTGRSTFTVALVFGAMIFGMVLAGGMDLTPTTSAAPDDGKSPAGAVSVPTSLSGSLPSFADLAEAVSPAVVLIQATKIETAAQRQGQGNDPFDFFFGPRQRRPQQQEPEDRRSDSAGSGFVISPDGLIITNHHVIEDATELTVTLEGRQYVAEVKGDDPATDIALLKIEAEEPLAFLALGDSETLRPGDWIMVIGSPLQLQNSVSVGVVSAKARSINITPDPSLESFIQTDAAINFGNSGGPLVDLHGRVVGIATAINFGAENIGFAVPVSTLERILPQLRESGAVRRGYLGVNIADVGYEEAEAFGLESTDGVLVTQVLADGPAAKAGLKHGDVILEVDGQLMKNNRQLIDYVAAQQPDTTVSVQIFRGGERMAKKITLDERPGVDGAPAPAEPEEESGIEWMGLRYQDLTPGIRSSHGMSDNATGVFVVDVLATSPLWDEGVRPGDLIAEVNGQAISGVSDFESVVNGTSSGYLRLYIERYNPRGGAMAAFFAIVPVPRN